MATEANFPCSGYVLSRLPMAGFNPIIYGRFWVITEAPIWRIYRRRQLTQAFQFSAGFFSHG